MIADLMPYPAYKDSGVPWLEEVPDHWDVVPGRTCFAVNHRPNTGLAENTVLSLSYGRIIVKPEDKLHGLVPASFETYQIVEQGDIICRPTDLQNDKTSLRFGLSGNRGIITSAYMCLRTSDRLSRRFGYLLLHAYDLNKIFYGLGSGLRQNLDWQDFKTLPCLLPPLLEQAAIVHFLDHVDGQIRRYIRAKQKLIKLLEEQKQAIIHRAVTRGLDPNVRLKPSGVEWLGDVPEHWDVCPAKYFYREIDERSETGDEELLSVSHITGVTPRSQKNITMFMAASYIGHKVCEPGDLVVNTMWAWMGALGIARQKGIVSPSYGVYRPLGPTTLLAEYADLLLRIGPYVSEYVCRSTGIRSSRLRLYPEHFLGVRILCPPINEQRAILETLLAKTQEMKQAIDSAQREIDFLQEYRTRLISDVVTGKLEVRGIELPATADETAELEDWNEGDVSETEELMDAEEVADESD